MAEIECYKPHAGVCVRGGGYESASANISRNLKWLESDKWAYEEAEKAYDSGTLNNRSAKGSHDHIFVFE